MGESVDEKDRRRLKEQFENLVTGRCVRAAAGLFADTLAHIHMPFEILESRDSVDAESIVRLVAKYDPRREDAKILWRSSVSLLADRCRNSSFPNDASQAYVAMEMIVRRTAKNGGVPSWTDQGFYWNPAAARVAWWAAVLREVLGGGTFGKERLRKILQD